MDSSIIPKSGRHVSGCFGKHVDPTDADEELRSGWRVRSVAKTKPTRLPRSETRNKPAVPSRFWKTSKDPKQAKSGVGQGKRSFRVFTHLATGFSSSQLFRSPGVAFLGMPKGTGFFTDFRTQIRHVRSTRVGWKSPGLRTISMDARPILLELGAPNSPVSQWRLGRIPPAFATVPGVCLEFAEAPAVYNADRTSSLQRKNTTCWFRNSPKGAYYGDIPWREIVI